MGFVTEEDVKAALDAQFHFPVLANVAATVVAAHDRPNHLVSHIRALRAQLLFRWLNEAQRKVLAITSPGRGEGRSWLTANLAVALAQIGYRTLLIDADLRNPLQHRLFGVDGGQGLSAVLTERAGSVSVRRIHDDLRLFLVAAGAVPPNPEELLTRTLFGETLEQLVPAYDVVLLDTPPALPTTDAQLIAARAGNALILARSNHTRKSSMVSVLSSLKQARVNVIGSVVNEFNGKSFFTA